MNRAPAAAEKNSRTAADGRRKQRVDDAKRNKTRILAIVIPSRADGEEPHNALALPHHIVRAIRVTRDCSLW